MPKKVWNTGKVSKFIEENSNSRLISEYKNWDTPITIKCECGEIFEAYIQNVKIGKLQCNKCGAKRRYKKIRTSYEQIKTELEELTKSILLTTKEEYDYSIDQLKKFPSSIRLKLLCPQCKGNYITGTYSKIKNMKNFYCHSCYLENIKISLLPKIKHYVEIESKSGCKLLSDKYLGRKEKLHFKCSCGNDFYTTWNAFKQANKRMCNECSEKIRKKKLTKYKYEDVKKYVESKGCILLSNKEDFTNTKDMLWIAGSCYHIFQITFAEFLKRKNSECPECITTDWNYKKVKLWIKKNMPGFRLKSRKYITQDHLLTFICPHNHEYKKSWNHTLRGERCTICTASNGEQMVYAFLRENRLKFKHQYSFKDCKDKRPLPFDYAVFYNNGNLKALIEVDGQQHFEPKTFGNISEDEAIKEFYIRKKHDEIKNEYCDRNHIKLIRIPYKKLNYVNQILYKELMEV